MAITWYQRCSVGFFIVRVSLAQRAQIFGLFFPRFPGECDVLHFRISILVSTKECYRNSGKKQNHRSYSRRYTGRVDELVSDTIIEEGSAEGIMDHLSDIYKKLDCFDIEGSEFGAIFQKMSGNSYEAGVPSLLSKLYSGEGGTMLLSKRSGLKKRYLPPRLFVTMLVGLQEPEYYITPIMIRQGLMRRVVLINVDKATSYKPLIDDRRFAAAPAINRFIEELTTKMIEFDKIHTTVCASGDEHILCNLHPTVQDKINEFSRKLDEAVDKEPTNLNIVKQTFGLHLSNLTIIEGILEGTFDSGTRTLSITESHLDPAYKFLIEATSNYESIIPSLGRKKESIVSYAKHRWKCSTKSSRQQVHREYHKASYTAKRK